MEDQSSVSTSSIPENPIPSRFVIEYSPASQFGILVGMAFVGMIIGNVLALVPILLKGISLTGLAAAMTDPANVSMIRWMQVIGTFFTFLFPVWIFQKIVRPPKDFLHVRTKSSKETWILVVLIAFASLPVTDLFGSFNQWIPLPARLAKLFHGLENAYNDQIMLLMQMKGIPDLIISLVLVALLPAIFEETFFRGAFQNVIVKWFKRPYLAILVTSIIFSAIHMSYYGFLPRAFLGVLLGCVYYWTKDLKLNILIHFLNNAISVVTFYVLSSKNQLTQEKMNESMPWYYQIIGVFVFSFLATLLYKYVQKQNTNTTQI
ncbi:MAG: hypothetical protein DI598_02990 [Pseudopedobacter saltans]|uniref:CAAX prenyl protease 2/Lysostaphin resistance protein A-like domain-containing protein n=1 Tax=Pseudopedobacter saltans TaxID=151895 RepID=A0A2W5FCZ2_9SPHI|nr:MAG: hypothetical protein DI598_02990 [Pseudopedobacter saltans]